MIKLGVSKLFIEVKVEKFLESLVKCDTQKQCKLCTWAKLIIFY